VSVIIPTSAWSNVMMNAETMAARLHLSSTEGATISRPSTSSVDTVVMTTFSMPSRNTLPHFSTKYYLSTSTYLCGQPIGIRHVKKFGQTGIGVSPFGGFPLKITKFIGLELCNLKPRT